MKLREVLADNTIKLAGSGIEAARRAAKILPPGPPHLPVPQRGSSHD